MASIITVQPPFSVAHHPFEMKTLFAFFALVALAAAYPGGYGGGGGGHEGGDYATQVIHGGPVVSRVFKGPGLGYFNNYAPKIDGPLVTRGIGPHVGSGGGKGGYH